MAENILEVKNLKKYFKTHKGNVHAVDNVSFTLERGKTLGIVGESGCGKSTTGRTILRLIEPTSGEVYFEGRDISKLSGKEMTKLRKDMQIIFQDPFSSLDPRMTVSQLIAEPLKYHPILKTKSGKALEKETEETVLELMNTVGLAERLYNAYPHELDGGRRQRIGIARALALQPKLIVCDEPVSALDVSIQAQILNMLVELQKELGLSLLFISHDIGVVRFISDRIGVMYLGTLMEETETEELFEHPLHPYTEALFEAVPDPYIKRTELKGLSGEQPVRTEDFKGCAFYTRCPYATDCCKAERPELREVKPGHKVACHRYNND